MDKPVVEDLKGVIDIFQVAKEYDVPTFSSSSLRFGMVLQEINTSGEKRYWVQKLLVLRFLNPAIQIYTGGGSKAWGCCIRLWAQVARKNARPEIPG